MQATLGAKLKAAIRPVLRSDAGFILERDVYKLFLRCFSVGLICFVAGCAGILLGRMPAHADAVWLANGILLAVLLLSPRRWWLGYVTAGFLASVLVHGVFHTPFARSLIFSIAGTLEVVVAAALLRRRESVRPSLAHGRTLQRFLLYGVVLAPLCAVAIVKIFGRLGALGAGAHLSFLELCKWYAGDALGFAVMTPAILVMEREELAALIGPAKRVETIGLLAGLTILSGLVFAQHDFPAAFVLFPALLLVIFRLRGSGAAIGIFLIAIPAAYFTAHGRGPFAMAQTGPLTNGILLLQCFLCALLVVVYAVSAALAERDRLQRDIIEAYREADVMAGLDHMTGLANRRTFDKELSREWRRAVRENGSLSLLMVDIDHFKRYNDHYGHIAGDECLRTIAAILAKTMVRSNDLAARYGGEEFAIVLPGSNVQGALMIAERLREAVARANLRHEGSTRGSVTVSVGVATAHPTRTMEETQLIQAADTALYLAKRNGRNQVTVWSPRPRDADEPRDESSDESGDEFRE